MAKRPVFDPQLDVQMRCKPCGYVYNFGVMFVRLFSEQESMPVNYVYVECPRCGANEKIFDPSRALKKSKPKLI